MPPGVLIFVLSVLVAVSEQKDVQINKCCVNYQYLGKDTNYTCAPGRNVSWTLKIYNPKKHELTKDTIPKNWLVVENRKPPCSNPRSFSAKSASTYLAFPNGSLFVPEYSEKLYHPSQYCLDYHAVLVCTEEAQNLTDPGAREEVLSR